MSSYEPKGRSIWQVLREADELFARKGNVFESLRRLARRLEEEGIPYALIGGLALILHGYQRFTKDVDIVLTRDGLAAFREKCVGRGYVPAFPGAQKTFRDTA